MARLARVVVPGVPHHVTQRGNRRLETFFDEADYAAYLSLLSEWCGRCGVAVWAYCLMPNHVHLIVTPRNADGLRRVLGEAHRRYTRRINFREGWRGHLWQGRFASFAMDERHLLRAGRYVECNPVRARLCRVPWRWRWSSAAAPGARAGLEGVFVRGSGRRGGGLAASPRANGPTAGDADLSRSHREETRTTGPPRQTGPQAKTKGEISMLSPDMPSKSSAEQDWVRP